MKTFLTAVVASVIATVAYAQSLNPRDMEAALAAAQTGATRPGDDALSCDALQQQLVAAVHDPAVQSYIKKAGIEAQQRKSELEEKVAQHAESAPSKGRVAAQTALALASSMVPGAGMPGFMAQAAQAEAQKAAAAKNIADQMRLASEMMAIMPQIMRGQRLIELAQARKCDWMSAPPQRQPQ